MKIVPVRTMAGARKSYSSPAAHPLVHSLFLRLHLLLLKRITKEEGRKGRAKERWNGTERSDGSRPGDESPIFVKVKLKGTELRIGNFRPIAEAFSFFTFDCQMYAASEEKRKRRG